MTPLLVVTGLLLAASGALKVKAAGRAGLGPPVLSLVELLAGLAVCVTAVARPPTPEGGLRVVYGAIALVLVSSLSMGLRMGARRRDREGSLGARLVKHVKYGGREHEE